MAPGSLGLRYPHPHEPTPNLGVNRVNENPKEKPHIKNLLIQRLISKTSLASQKLAIADPSTEL